MLKEITYLNADKALRLADAFQASDDMLLRVIDAIEEAADQGAYWLSIPTELTAHIAESLQTLGYTVKSVRCAIGQHPQTVISWHGRPAPSTMPAGYEIRVHELKPIEAKLPAGTFDTQPLPETNTAPQTSPDRPNNQCITGGLIE